MFSQWSIDHLKHCLQSKSIFLSRDAVIIFVCGGKSNIDYPTARDRFLQYATRHLGSFQFFRAEDFFSFAVASTIKDLLTIENDIAKFCDCLIIFIESSSAIAELGAFSNSDRLAKMILAVNDADYELSNSFIAKGPIAKINRLSKFGPTVYLNMENALANVDQIEKRLAKIERKKNRRLSLTTYEEFLNESPKNRMMFLYDVISFFFPITLGEIIRILELFYKKTGYDITTELNMLQTLELVRYIDHFYLANPAIPQKYFVYKGLDVKRVRSANINFYHKNSRDRLKYLPFYNRAL